MTFTNFVKNCVNGIKNYYIQTYTPNYEFKERLRIWFRDFEYGLSNLIVWFPTIWCDRYWDSYYLFKIMRKKLFLMEKNIREAGIHENAGRDADNIQICIDCLDRLIKDEYHEVAFKDHDEKWGKLKWETKPSEEYPDLHQMLFSRENALTKEQIKKEMSESKKCWKHANKLQENDLSTLFTVMEKEILKWWD